MKNQLDGEAGQRGKNQSTDYHAFPELTFLQSLSCKTVSDDENGTKSTS